MFWEGDAFDIKQNLRSMRAKQVDRISQYLCFKNRERKDVMCYQDMIEKKVKIDKVIYRRHIEKKKRQNQR